MLPMVVWPSGPHAKVGVTKDEIKLSVSNDEASFLIF